MSKLSDDTEEQTGIGAQGALPVPSPKRAFGFLDSDGYKAARSPLVGQFLRDHIERLEEEICELKPYRQNYYETRAKLDVLQERRGFTRTAAGISSVMLAVGGVGIGVSKDLWDIGPSGYIIGISSILLIGASFLMKVKDS